jgi:transcriptional regulator with XRE-family HTH domain
MDKQMLGEAIKKQRKRKGLKQFEVSERTGLSRNYISDIENGRYMPSVDALSRLAVCLGMDLNIITMSEIQDESTLDSLPEKEKVCTDGGGER